MVALLWGTTIALAFGFLGAIVTSLLPLLIAAVGVWNGAWFRLLKDHAGLSSAIPTWGKMVRDAVTGD
jgi:hypothetical protein